MANMSAPKTTDAVTEATYRVETLDSQIAEAKRTAIYHDKMAADQRHVESELRALRNSYLDLIEGAKATT